MKKMTTPPVICLLDRTVSSEFVSSNSLEVRKATNDSGCVI